MAFDEVTLFEFDLTDAQFGPREMDVPDKFSGKVGADADDEEATAEYETDEDSSGGPSLGKMLVTALVVSVVATLVAKRLRGDDEETTQIEFEAEADVEGESPEIDA